MTRPPAAPGTNQPPNRRGRRRGRRAQPPTPQLVPLQLPPEDQWVLNDALLDRIEADRRAGREPPPEVVRAYGKLGAGDLEFTAAELRCLRAELGRCLRTSRVTPRYEAGARRIIDRIEAALERLWTPARVR